MDKTKELEKHVAFAVSIGCRRCDKMLGIQKMPDGYALMLNGDETHFFWLRHDGTEGHIDWNKWRVRRCAIANRSLSDECEARKAKLR